MREWGQSHTRRRDGYLSDSNRRLDEYQLENMKGIKRLGGQTGSRTVTVFSHTSVCAPFSFLLIAFHHVEGHSLRHSSPHQ